MTQHARVIQNLRQLLDCNDHQRIAIEQLTINISRDLLTVGDRVVFERFSSALEQYHGDHSSAWRRTVVETLTALENAP